MKATKGFTYNLPDLEELITKASLNDCSAVKHPRYSEVQIRIGELYLPDHTPKIFDKQFIVLSKENPKVIIVTGENFTTLEVYRANLKSKALKKRFDALSNAIFQLQYELLSSLNPTRIEYDDDNYYFYNTDITRRKAV